jgi:hypothetical protein
MRRIYRRYRLVRRFVRRRYSYAKYLIGCYPTVYEFTCEREPEAFTLIVPNSSGDVAMTSSVTRYLKAAFPQVQIFLITHPRYMDVGRLNPDYDAVVGYGRPHSDIAPWKLPYRSQVAVARELTPDMDRLFVCQPNAWCPGLVDKVSIWQVQQDLCGVPDTMRVNPRLRVPREVRSRAAEFRRTLPGRSFFLAPNATTIGLGSAAKAYWHGLAQHLVERGAVVFYNSKNSPVQDRRCVTVGDRPLLDAVALAVDCDAVVSSRSGFSDIVGFCAPTLRHRILYPSGPNPISRLSWLDWCSVKDLGVAGAVECFVDLHGQEDAAKEIDRTVAWLGESVPLRQVGKHVPPASAPWPGLVG